MKVLTQPDGSLALELSGEELEWLHQTLNECCNGFRIQNFEAKIGVDPAEVRQMLEQINDAYDAPIGYEG
jgi:hypothetical protein